MKLSPRKHPKGSWNKNCFFIKINKIGKPLARLIKKEKTPVNWIRYEKGDVITGTTEI